MPNNQDEEKWNLTLDIMRFLLKDYFAWNYSAKIELDLGGLYDALYKDFLDLYLLNPTASQKIK